jgi:hypothetical protein
MMIRVMAKPAQLTWSDFRPVDTLPDDPGEDAQTSTEMSEMKNIRPVSNKGTYSLPDLELTVGLKRSETVVVKSAQKTRDLLKHEQGHFDITVLSVRAFATELQRLNAPSAGALVQQIDALRQKHQRFADSITEKYDIETNHSRNKDLQDKWNIEIQGAMGAKNVVSLRGMPL